MKFIRVFVTCLILFFLASCDSFAGSDTDSSVTDNITTNTPVYYTVTVDGESQSVLEGTTAVEPNIPTREGYTFLMWISNGVEFTFDTIINQDYIVESKWVLTLDITDLADEMNHLQGGFAKLNDKFISKTDNSIGLFENLRMNEGRFSFTVRGDGGYGVYFDLDKSEIKRGHPTGSYYALKIDNVGNMYLIRAIDGHEVTVQVSLILKDDFNSQTAYNLEISRVNKVISVSYKGNVVMSYYDNLPLEGYAIALSADKKATEFDVVNYAPITSAKVIDGVLNFSDNSKHSKHLVVINNTEYVVEELYQMDLNKLNLEEGIHQGSIYKVMDGNKEFLIDFEFGTEKAVNDMTTYNGDFVLYGNTYIYSKDDYSMGLFDNQEFTNGNVKIKVIPGNNDDAGIVFRANTNGSTNFWEDSMVEYYVALINMDGIVLLGKVNFNGATWTLLASKNLTGYYSPLNEYELEVRAADNRFMVLVDGKKYIDYVDLEPFNGNQIGIRTTTKGTKFSDFGIYEPQIVGMTVHTLSDSVALNEELDLNNIKAFIEYDNGALEEITVTSDMLSGVDTSSFGKKAITLSYENSVSSFEKVFYINVTEEDYLYYKDFENLPDSSVLPIGWYPQQGNASSSSYQIINGALNMSSLKTNYPVALQFGLLETDNYTVEIEFDIKDKMDTGRWIGITTRLQETAGWWKGSIGLTGSLAINNNTNTDLSKPTWVQAVKEDTGVKIDLNTRHTLQLAINGLEVCLYLDGVHYVTHTLPEKYSKGGFGIVISGVTANIYKVTARETKAEDFNRHEGIEISGPNTITVGETLDLEVKVTSADGSIKVLSNDEYTLEGFDSSKAGNQTITIKYGNYTATHNVEVILIDTIETYYQMDLSKIDSSTNLPEGWIWKCENKTATYQTTSEGIKVSSLTKTPVVSLQCTDLGFEAKNYTYELQVKIINYQDTNRWFGLTSRGTEENGYIRTHLVLNGKVSFGRQANWFLGKSGAATAKNSTSVQKGTVSAFTKGQVVTLKIVAYEMNFAFYLDGQLLYVASYDDSSFGAYDFSQGTVGFTCGGGEYLIQSAVVRSGSQVEKSVFSKGE